MPAAHKAKASSSARWSKKDEDAFLKDMKEVYSAEDISKMTYKQMQALAKALRASGRATIRANLSAGDLTAALTAFYAHQPVADANNDTADQQAGPAPADPARAPSPRAALAPAAAPAAAPQVEDHQACQAQLEALRAELADERAARAEADNTIAELRQEVQAAGHAQLEALRAELADERAARARADETIADFREEVQADEVRNEVRRSHVAALRARDNIEEALKRENGQLREDLAYANNRYCARRVFRLERRVAELNSQLDQAIHARNAVVHENTAITANIDSTRAIGAAEIFRLEQEAEDFRREWDTAAMYLNTAMQQLQESRAQVARMQAQLDTIEQATREYYSSTAPRDADSQPVAGPSTDHVADPPFPSPPHTGVPLPAAPFTSASDTLPEPSSWENEGARQMPERVGVMQQRYGSVAGPSTRDARPERVSDYRSTTTFAAPPYAGPSNYAAELRYAFDDGYPTGGMAGGSGSTGDFDDAPQSSATMSTYERYHADYMTCGGRCSFVHDEEGVSFDDAHQRYVRTGGYCGYARYGGHAAEPYGGHGGMGAGAGGMYTA